jgi:DNA-binding transcriptional LysR family regulator
MNSLTPGDPGGPPSTSPVRDLAGGSRSQGTRTGSLNKLAGKLCWDDLRIILAIGEQGTLAAAAERLGVDSSTIARRLAKAEEALGAVLFHRRRTGYSATAQGEELIAVAGRIELDVVTVARRISGNGRGHAGELRITTTDFIFTLLAQVTASFRAIRPAIMVELILGSAPLNLARGEADIALRATDDPPENLFGRQVATIAWAPYAASFDAALPPAGEGSPFDREWISYSGQLSALKARRFIDERVGNERIGFRSDSVTGAAAAAAAGLGTAYLPCMLGDLHPGLRRVGAIEHELDDPLWLLTHPDIRKSEPVRDFMKHCIDAVGRSRGLIEGMCGSGAVEPVAARTQASFAHRKGAAAAWPTSMAG